MREDKERLQLVVVCDIEGSEMDSLIDACVSDPELRKEVILTGPVQETDLDQLYLNCRLFVFPSLNEGFGLPVLEAMSFGCPCIVSNSTSLPELVGDSAIKFDATNFSDLVEKVSACIFNDATIEARIVIRCNSIP